MSPQSSSTSWCFQHQSDPIVCGCSPLRFVAAVPPAGESPANNHDSDEPHNPSTCKACWPARAQLYRSDGDWMDSFRAGDTLTRDDVEIFHAIADGLRAGRQDAAPEPNPNLGQIGNSLGVGAPAGERDAECVWSDDEGCWATGCGHYFEINDGTPSENGMRFCAYCGKPLVEVPAPEGEDEND